VTDAGGRRTSFTVDDERNLTAFTAPDGAVTVPDRILVAFVAK
jgi:YD repeat-containing protein